MAMADRRRLDAICTFTGRAIRPLDPKPSDIDILDIAHSLANQCRFTGHTKEFYSVAQHSVHVSELCNEFPLEGLLHDASETYLSDIARPIKKADDLLAIEYRGVEAELQFAIEQRFNLNPASEAEVKKADDAMLGAEARDLMHEDFFKFGMSKFDYSSGPNPIIPWEPEKAESLFLERYMNLTAKLWVE
jgi:hypothetical protein